jgi:hypothetical protein
LEQCGTGKGEREPDRKKDAQDDQHKQMLYITTKTGTGDTADDQIQLFSQMHKQLATYQEEKGEANTRHR